MKNIAIIGAGPGGLMAAQVLSQQPGLVVSVYDAMPSAGRKFLQAGRGGLNITHSKPFNEFVQAYGKRQKLIEPWIKNFTPQDVRAWVEGFGIETFVGSSGRVYPQDMKAAPLLRAWLHRLRQQGVAFLMRHRWQGWNQAEELVFQTPEGQISCKADIVILALGGASWPQLGSDGRWTQYFNPQDLAVFQPANCGFNQAWSAVFKAKFAGQPLKSVAMTVIDQNHQAWCKKGELLISEQGLEGSLIYALSARIRDTLSVNGKVDVELDLMPDQTLENLVAKMNKPRGKQSWSNHLKRCGVDALRANLLREVLDQQTAQDMTAVAQALKHYVLNLTSPRPIEEAISSAGGVQFEALNDQSMLTTRPGYYCVGEMLDWEAPTGGYLLTAVLAQARFVAHAIVKQHAR